MNDDATGEELPPMTPEERQQALVQAEVVTTAYQFLNRFYEEGDLTAAWEYVDPLLRRCWAQWWLDANRSAVTASGFDLEEVADNFVAEADNHPLWTHFQRVLLRDFRNASPLDVPKSGIGMAPRLIAPDVELLYVHQEMPEGGQWEPGTESLALPMVMHLDGGRWKVMNVGYERIPEPGWPPTLW